MKRFLSVFLLCVALSASSQITQQQMEDAFYNALVDFSSVVGDGGAIFTVPMNPDYFELAGYLTTTAEGFDGPLFSFAYEWNPILQNLPLYLRNLSSNQLSHTSYLSGILDRSNYLYNIAWSNWNENVQIKESLGALRTNIASRLDVPLSHVVSGVSDVSDGIARLDSDLNGVGGLVDAIQHDTDRLLAVSRASTNLLNGLSDDLSESISDLQGAIEDGLADINVNVEVLLQQINDMYTYIESLSGISGDLYNLIQDLPGTFYTVFQDIFDFNVEDLPTHYDVTVDNWPNIFDGDEWWLAMEALSNLVRQAESQHATLTNLSSVLQDDWYPATTNYYANSTNFFASATNYFVSMLPTSNQISQAWFETNAIATNAVFQEAVEERDLETTSNALVQLDVRDVFSHDDAVSNPWDAGTTMGDNLSSSVEDLFGDVSPTFSTELILMGSNDPGHGLQQLPRISIDVEDFYTRHTSAVTIRNVFTALWYVVGLGLKLFIAFRFFVWLAKRKKN